MQANAFVTRRLCTAPLPPAITIALPDTTRRVMDGLAAINPLHPRGDRRRALEHLGREHLAGLGVDWQGLDSQLREARDPDRRLAVARQQAVLRHLYAVLTAGADLLGDLQAGQVCGEAPAWREAVAQRLRQESLESACGAVAAPGTASAALAYAALVPPAHRGALLGPMLRDAATLGRVHALCARPGHGFMPEAALLMVRHYAHPDHGTFDLLRAVHELETSNRELAVGLQFADVTSLFAEGIGAIHRLAPMRARAPLFKGAVPEASWQLRAGLAFCLGRPLSTSRALEHSYLGRQREGQPAYVHLFTYRDGPQDQQKVDAVDITLFHPVQTLHQREALLLPGQAFQLTGLSAGQAQGKHGPIPAQLVDMQKIGRSADWARFAAYYGHAPSA